MVSWGKLGTVTGEQLVELKAVDCEEMETRTRTAGSNGGFYCCTIHVCAKCLFSLNIKPVPDYIQKGENSRK